MQFFELGGIENDISDDIGAKWPPLRYVSSASIIFFFLSIETMMPWWLVFNVALMLEICVCACMALACALKLLFACNLIMLPAAFMHLSIIQDEKEHA